MSFNHNKIVSSSTEFMVSLEVEQDNCYFVPASDAVLRLLVDMLKQTRSTFDKLEDEGEIEYGERYGTLVHVTCSINDPTIARVVEIFHALNAPSNANALDKPELVDFYFARFTDDIGQVCMGIKTPVQFKATLKKKLIHIFDDQLQIVGHNIFKLDSEFDFIVYGDHIDIIKPSQFMRVAKTEEVLRKKLPENIIEASLKIPIVDFDSISDFIVSRKRVMV